MNLLNHPLHSRSHKVLRCLWDFGSWCWTSPSADGGISSSRTWLRGFLLLKLVTLLLFPNRAFLSLVFGCPFSLKAMLLLRSSQISTKPSTVFLRHLALTDGLLLLHLTLKLGHLCLDLDSSFAQDVLDVIYNHLTDAHLLASLLFLGLLGLEATLVSRWPLQTRSIRTSHWAQFGCSLVWTLVSFELMLVMFAKLQNSEGPPSLVSLEDVSFFLRRSIWLCDLWLHYNIIYNKPQKRRSSFH